MSYILDTNIFIEAWNKYYAPDFCPGYWDVILSLANDGQVFIPQEVYDELQDKDDNLSAWIKSNQVIIEPTDESIQNSIKQILADPKGRLIVNSNKKRNLADPWVIAHAMSNGHTVVTKEILTGRDNDPRIPDVCEVFGVEYIDDFDLVRRLKLNFQVTA